MKHVFTIAAMLSVSACNADEADRNAPASENLQFNATTNAPGQRANGAVDGTNQTSKNAGSGAEGGGGDSARDPKVTNGELAWNASTTARGHKLSYGRPQTDDVRAALRCASNREVVVQVFPSKRSDRPGEMSVSSGGASERVAADATESMLGGLTVSGDVDRNSQVLRNFRNGNPLSVTWGSHSVTVPAQSGEISTFFERCG